MILVLILVLKVPQKQSVPSLCFWRFVLVPTVPGITNLNTQLKGTIEMNYMTANQAAERWGVSEEIVRRYCREERIEDAYQEDGVWFIPADASKPTRKKKEAPQLPKLLLALRKQRDTGRYAGLYDYLQINMVYSNNRMASNRMTRQQVETLYKSDKIFTVNEALKINDVIEARNHFICVDHILTEAMAPLTQSFVQRLHTMTYSDCCDHRRKPLPAGGYRKTQTTPKFGKTTPPKDINKALGELFRKYEAQPEIGFHEILDLHVRFERIRPFDDCNGRIGRLLMLKECLRHNVIPFIIDDKRRTGYLEGIRQWDKDRSILMDVCMEAQMRFEAQIALQGLLECHALYYQPISRDGGKK